MTGIELITQERQEQIEKHHWTLEHDRAEHEHGELKYVALHVLGAPYTARNEDCDWAHVEDYIMSSEKSEIDRLVIAGALIAAEIDRLQE